jgi:hypothetical protein
MKAGEIQALKDLVDKILPEVELAECERLPVAYQTVAKSILGAIGPALQAALDGQIAKIPVDPA